MAQPFGPGLAGWFGAEAARNAATGAQIQQLGGLLGIQNQLETAPLQREQLRMAVERARINNLLVQGEIAGGTPQGAPLAFGAGGVSLPGGGQANLQTGQAIPAAQPGFDLTLSPQKLNAYLLSGDPGLKARAEAAIKYMMEKEKPVVDRGFGIKVLNPVTGKYELASDPKDIEAVVGAQARGRQNVELPYRAPVSLPASGGQNVNIFPQEFPQIQAGQVPARLQPQAVPQMQIPQAVQAQRDAEAAQIRAREQLPNGGGMIPSSSVLPQQGLGQIGLTQSQADIISQKRQTAGGTAIDEAFGKDFPTFINGGVQDATKQLAQLKDVSIELSKPNANLTGPYLGSLPDSVKKFTNPQSIAMRERVEEVVQRSLRAILGAQFTEREGERLIARAYNPDLPEKENAIRVQRLFTQLSGALENKKAAAQYFSKNGTLEGWNGKLPSISDFDPSVGAEKRAVTRTGMYNGKKVVEYSDGTVEYAP